jgi:hypothetical protein
MYRAPSNDKRSAFTGGNLMVRCTEFYAKWERNPNFCDKNPLTADRIDVFLDLLPIIVSAALESEILSEDSEPMGTIITERACRPLISIKDSKIRLAAIQQIVQIAESKKMDGLKPLVTTKEVEAILVGLGVQVKKATTPKPKDKFESAKTQLKAVFLGVRYSLADINEALTRIDELSSALST